MLRERFRTALERVPGGVTAVRLVLRTLDVCLDYRVTGLAAEAAFFMLLSLPPLVLGLFGGLGYVSGWIGPDAASRVVAEIETYAARFLTEDSITDLLVPTVQDVLARGRPELVSVGFLLSLWAGSRALNVFIDTVSIMYGQKDVRGIIQLRALSLSLYTVGTLAGIVLLPIVLLGPSIIGAWLPPELDFLRYLYWPTVLFVSVLALTSLYHVSTPRRGPWLRDIPGAVLAMTIWLLASYVVRASLEASLGGLDHLRPAQRTDRPAHLALCAGDRHPHRVGSQRGHPHDLAGRAQRRGQQRRPLASVERACDPPGDRRGRAAPRPSGSPGGGVRDGWGRRGGSIVRGRRRHE